MLVGEVFARMGLDSKQYEKDLSRLEGVTRRQATTLGAVFKNAFSVALGMGVFEAVKRGVQTIASTAIGFNAQMEQARIGFTTMLGSAERAEVFLRDMSDFAARTPFEFPELLDASKRMLAYGFAAEDVLPTMEAVGNASADVGLGTEGINRIILALGQVRAKGKLSAEEMRQLTETGIPAWEILAEAMNKTTAEITDMQQKGLIPAHEAIQILIEGMNKRFPDMMKNMVNTWEGVTSSIKDIWRRTIGELTSGLFNGLKTWLQGVRDWMSDFYNTFQQFGLQAALAKSFGPEIAALVSILSAVMRGFGTIVRAVTGFITQYGKQIRFVAVVMGTYLVLLKTVTLAKWLATVATTALTNSQLLLAGQSSATTGIIGFLSNVITFYKVQMLTASATTNVFTGALVRLRAALYALWTALGPIGWALIVLSAAVAGGMALWGKYIQSLQKTASLGFGDFRKAQDGMAKSAGAAADATEDQADALKETGKAANKNLQSFDEVHQLQEDMAGSAEDLAESMGFDDTELGAPEAGGFEIPDIEAQLEEMKPTLSGFWEWIKQGFANAWGGVKTAINNAWNALKEWAQAHPIIAGIAAAITALFIPALIKAGVQAAVNGAKVVAAWVLQAAEAVKSIATQVAQFVIAGAKWAWLGVQATVNAGKTVLAWTMQGLEAVKSVAIQVAQFVIAGAKWAWLGVQAGISAAQVAAAWVLQRVQAIASVAVQVAQMVLVGAKWVWMGVTAMANAAVMAAAWFVALGPVAWVIATVAAIALAVALNWDWIKEKTQEVWEIVAAWLSEKWGAIESAAKTAWEWIKKYIIDPIQGAWTWLEETWNSIANFLDRTWKGIKKGASDIWKGIANTIIGFVNKIIDGLNIMIRGINKLSFEAPDWVPKFGGKKFGFNLKTINPISYLATGTNYVPQDMLAFLHEGEAVVPKKYNPAAAGLTAETIEQAVYRAFINALRIMQASAKQDDKELVLKIDNTVLARMQLPAIIREGQRQGLDLVVRPQGV